MRNAVATALLLGTLSLTAYAGSLKPADQTAVESVISGQLNAFNADRHDEAFSYAAPLIQKYFGSVDRFMGMVKQGYSPVHRNKNYSFGESFVDPMGRPAQRVVITAQDGKRYEAVYTMELQPDGTWKIAGCILLELPGAEA